MNNRDALSKFREPTENFKKFLIGKWTKNTIPSLYFNVHINGKYVKAKKDFCEKLYKECNNKKYLIKISSEFYSCDDSQYKQVLLKIRNLRFRFEKKSLKNFNTEKIRFQLREMQLRKINFAKTYDIDIYNFENDKYVLNFKPFSLINDSPKKKDLIIKFPNKIL